MSFLDDKYCMPTWSFPYGIEVTVQGLPAPLESFWNRIQEHFEPIQSPRNLSKPTKASTSFWQVTSDVRACFTSCDQLPKPHRSKWPFDSYRKQSFLKTAVAPRGIHRMVECILTKTMPRYLLEKKFRIQTAVEELTLDSCAFLKLRKARFARSASRAGL